METTFILHKEVKPDIALEDLEKIRVDWLAYAEEQMWPETFWRIVRFLGERKESRRSDALYVFEFDGIEVYGTINGMGFYPGKGCFAHKQGFGIMIEDHYVMHWEWKVWDKPEMGDLPIVLREKLVFIPGEWVNQLLSHANKAWEKEAQFNASTIEMKRQELVEALLIGVDL